MPNAFARAISDADVRRLAGEQCYQQGFEQFSLGRVQSLEDRGDCFGALVRGNPDYAVTLAADHRVLDYSCDCPEGSEGVFCMHSVAAALAWLNRTGTVGEAKETKLGGSPVRRAFEKAVRVRDFVHYRDAGSWARGVNRAIDSIEQLIHTGQAAEAIELCEWALQQLLGAIERVDDSDGHFALLRDRLQDLHLRACQESQPDPVELARRLFHLELRCDFDIFHGAVARYAPIFRENGLQVYRELAEAEWCSASARGDRGAQARGGEGFRITQIMQALARVSGDIEQLVVSMSRDLSSACAYWEIAEVYREANQHDNALLWAEKGLQAFPNHTDARLRKFAAEEYHRRGRHDVAIALWWTAFSERVCLETYKTLEQHAKQADVWPDWRERALDEVRLRIAQAKENARGQIRSRRMEVDDDHSRLVEIFLYEANPEAAWREAQAGGCSDDLWLRLASAREKDYPADAAPIYLKQAEVAIAGANNGRYPEAVALLMKAAVLMRRLGRGAEFGRQVDALRAKYKVKRSFIKLVEQKRKSLYPSQANRAMPA